MRRLRPSTSIRLRLFRCNRRRLIDCDNPWPYLRDLYQTPRVAGTVNFDHLIRGYNLNLPQRNPSGIIPIGPELDFWEPPCRNGLGS
jgi:glutathionyl-hydroquinone reductase